GVEKIFLVACAMYLVYIPSGLLARPDWGAALHDVVRPHAVVDTAYVIMIVGLVGTTIAPWMQFYQQSAIVEKGVRMDDYRYVWIDVLSGCVMVSVVAFFIIVACAATLHHQGIAIETAGDAAQALRPLAGAYCAALFAF